MPCPAGTYNDSHGVTSAAGCAACPAGARCPGGSAEALNCAPGTVAPTHSSAACVKCVAGKHQGKAGQLACDDCEKGTYCEAGANAETRCKAGYYSDKVRADSSNPNLNPNPTLYSNPNSSPNLNPYPNPLPLTRSERAMPPLASRVRQGTPARAALSRCSGVSRVA